jgi:hypothetical protein
MSIRIPVSNEFGIDAPSSPRLPSSVEGINFRGASDGINSVRAAIGSKRRVKAEDFSGVIALGQGVANLGQNLSEIAQRNQSLTNTRWAASFEAKKSQSDDQLNVLLAKEKDPNKHTELAKKHTSDFIAGLNYEGVSEDQRQHVEQNVLPTWQSKTVTGVTLNAVNRNEKRAAEELQALVDIGVDKRKPEMVVAGYRSMFNEGLIGGNQLQSLIEGAVGKISQNVNAEITSGINDNLARGNTAGAIAAYENHPDNLLLEKKYREPIIQTLTVAKETSAFQDLAAIDPNKALDVVSKLQKGENVEGFGNSTASRSPAKLQEWDDFVRRRIFSDDQQAQSDAANAVLEGKLVTERQLDQDYWGKRLTLTGRLKIGEMLSTMKQEKMANDPDRKEWGKIASTILQLGAPQTPQDYLDYADHEREIKMRTAGEYRDKLLEMLAAQKNGAPDDAVRPALRILGEAFDDKNYYVPYQQETPAESGLKYWLKRGVKAIATQGATEFFGATPQQQAKQGTAVNAKTRIDVAAEKVKQGQAVIDQRLAEQANKAMIEGVRKVKKMQMEGKTEKEITEFAHTYKRTNAIRFGITPTQAPPVSKEEKEIEKANAIIDKNDISYDAEPTNSLVPKLPK